MKLGEKIDKLMDEHGHTQGDLARRIGTQRSSISSVVLGKQGLRPKQLLALARLYSVSLESLLDDSKEIERFSPRERLLQETIRYLGTEESLRRLLTADTGTKCESPTRHPWGQLDKPDTNPGDGKGSLDQRKGTA